ncbi:MAG: peptide-methionine (S)-S-oxide reductase MsrA [Cytophagales bacterium]|nr:peptide-methionine (S)-S-oxide reductase MsrA [Cytophagales bacterium]
MKKIFCHSLMLFVCCIFSSPQSFSYSMEKKKAQLDTATFGAGCYWCVEAIFQELKGVKEVQSGFSGGNTPDPTYREVCTGRTGYAEVVNVVYNPATVSFKELLEVFWKTHNPTTLNRQGADIGSQYRSVIFYHNEEQKALAEKYKQALNRENAFGKPVVTEISPYRSFYPAKTSHQDYYAKNKDQQYCRLVIKPKLDKFRKAFGSKIKNK